MADGVYRARAGPCAGTRAVGESNGHAGRSRPTGVSVHHLDWLENAAKRRRARQALLWSVGLTLALYLIPFGQLLAYPLMLLSTLFHELGHGIAAVAVGGSFESLVIFADGSGVAQHGGSTSSAGHALVAAGGLVGPAIVAAIGFVVGRSARGARVFLGVLGLGLALVTVLV